MKKITLHDKAVILCEGGAVWHDHLFLRAGVVDEYIDPCYVCEMNSLCHKSMAELCTECDEYDGKYHCLILKKARKQ